MEETIESGDIVATLLEEIVILSFPLKENQTRKTKSFI